MHNPPETKLRSLVGAQTAKKLATLGLETVDDLLRHYPRRYVALGEMSDLAALRPGGYATVMARVVEAVNRPYRQSRGGMGVRTEVKVTDGNATVTLTFFGQRWRVGQLTPGTVGIFAGEVTVFRNRLQLTHPMYEPLHGPEALEGRLARGIVPIYRANAKVSSVAIERAIEPVLMVADVEEVLPEDIRERHGFPSVGDAFEFVHRPRSAEQWQLARDRFRYEEAFVVQTIFAQRRQASMTQRATARPRRDDGVRAAFSDRLPFELTAGQTRVVDEIAADLERTHPMHRLLQGEVGSGKTVVALMAMLQAVDAGAQAVLMAPTEVLAQQHHRGIVAMLGDLAQGGMLGGAEHATRVALLTGSQGAAARREALLDVASGAAGIVVGTHAVLEETVQFADLGLVVIDEQHRFGVEQRAALVDRSEGVKPHVLVMTATPIPRTIAMTVFGDLETSTLRELPAGRKSIQTTLVPAAARPDWLERAWQRVREEVAAGRQAYVVVSRIGTADEPRDPGESNAPTTHALTELFGELQHGPLAGLRLGMLHGRQGAEEKDATMSAFSAGELDVLVATTVIEVGVDVPNATVMVIMDAERFGVSQLHQLRGRVGRGGHAGLCLLVTETDPDSPSAERLQAVAETSDGFELARLDAELRREGDVLGAAQSGVRSSLRLLSVVKDESVIEQARADASEIVQGDPALEGHPFLAAAVRRLEETHQADYLERT